MPLSPGDAHVDAALTNLSVAFAQGNNAFMTGQFLPTVMSSKQSDKYHIWNKNDWHRIEADLLAPNTETKGACPSLSQDTFFCDVNGVHFPVSHQLAANADDGLALDQAATEYVTEQLLKKRDKDWATVAYNNTAFGTPVTPSPLWDATGATIIKDICDQKTAIVQNTGQSNLRWVFVTTPDVWCTISNDEDVIDRIKYTQTGVMDTQLFGSVIGADVFVMPAMETTSAEGAVTDTFDFLAPAKNALLMAVAPAPSVLRASAMYTFVWNGLPEVSSEFPAITRVPDPLRHSERVEGILAYDHKVVSQDLGTFFEAVIS